MKINRQNVNSIQNADDVRELFLVNSANLLSAKNGNYWRLELKDATGIIEAKIWSPLAQTMPEIEVGTFLFIEARASLYKEQVQLNIDQAKIYKANQIEELDYADFLPSSLVPAKEMYAQLEQLCKKVFKHKAWKKFVFSVLRNTEIKEKLLHSVAAKSVHHAYMGGLLEHQLSVGKLCLKICEQYNELDRQCLFAAAILHDIGKTDELSSGLINDYTDIGRLVGHISIGLQILEPYLQKSGLETSLQSHFKHLVLSHHGEREFGSPVLPATKEAFILHFADNIDAKLAQFNNIFKESDDEIKWSAYQNILGRSLCQIEKSPEPESKKAVKAKLEQIAAKKAEESAQCSLL